MTIRFSKNDFSQDDTAPSTLRRFLLGQLEAVEAERWETAVLEGAAVEGVPFDGDAIFDLLGAAEDDLIDEYTAGALTAEEKQRFEEHFASGGDARLKELRGRIAVASLLARQRPESRRATADPANPDLVAAPLPWRAPAADPAARSRRSAWLPLMAVAASLLLAVTGWLSWRMIDLRQESDHLRQQALASQTELEQVRATLDTVASSELEPRASQELARTQERIAELEARSETINAELEAALAQLDARSTRPTQTVSFVLSIASGVRGVEDARRHVIPAGTERVDLQIDLDTESGFDSYRVLLRTLAGEEVWSRAGLSATDAAWGRALNLAIPAASLAAGEYELMVFGHRAGALEELAFVPFEIGREDR